MDSHTQLLRARARWRSMFDTLHTMHSNLAASINESTCTQVHAPCWHRRQWGPSCASYRLMMHRCRAQDEAASGDSSAPWNIGSYYTKQKERALDDLGQIVESPDNTEEPVGWNADSKLRLAVQVSDGKCAAQAPCFPLNSQCMSWCQSSGDLSCLTYGARPRRS